jgi:hypothetical protein
MSPVTQIKNTKKKREPVDDGSDDATQSKKPRASQSQNVPLITPHEAILAELASKYNILPASVISSTKIKKRVSSITTHLSSSGGQPNVGLLYARTADVCKLITIVEQTKRVLAEEGLTWYQYNQLFTLPTEAIAKKNSVEETVLEEAAERSDSDGFEVMESRFEKAVLPSVSTQVTKSMRVFLSVKPIPELKLKNDVTSQSSEEAKS